MNTEIYIMPLQSLILCPPSSTEYYKHILTDILKADSIKTSNIDNGCIIISEHSTENIMRKILNIRNSNIKLDNITWLVRSRHRYLLVYSTWYSIHNSRTEYPFLDSAVKVRSPNSVSDTYTIVSKDKFFN